MHLEKGLARCVPVPYCGAFAHSSACLGATNQRHSIVGFCALALLVSVAPIETRQYLDDVDDLLPKNSTARDFFNAMLQRYPNRRLGATTLWAGTSTLYASRDRHGGEVFHDSIAGWFK
jgi:hypothetical protein